MLASLPHERMVNCFLPTTPNPTSGFYLAVPEDDLYDVDMSVEDAFKVIMSAGLVSPESLPVAKRTAADSSTAVS